MAQNSGITKNQHIKVIPTGVELNIFAPISRADARTDESGSDKQVIYFGAGSLSDPRKGGQYLAPIVDILNNNLRLRERYMIVAPGYNSSVLDGLDCKIRAFGHIDNRHKLALLQASADVTVLPYIEDNLPNVALESLACGTPVCAFAIGGLKDVVIDGVTGYLARPFDVWDLACKVAKTLENPPERSRIRSWAESHYDVRDQAEAYIRLFEDLRLSFKSVTYCS
ncbi:MAG: glycosyltransferase [Pirellulaceae bacterium]